MLCVVCESVEETPAVPLPILVATDTPNELSKKPKAVQKGTWRADKRPPIKDH